MQRTPLLFSAVSFVLVAVMAYFLASQAVNHLERTTKESIDTALQASGQNWTKTRTDGLIVHLTGLAPSEVAHLRAIEIIGQLIDANRILDRTTVLQSSGIVEPRFSLEVLRNLDRISLIGLIPERVGRNFILDRAEKIANGGKVTDMLESSEHRAPSGWATNLNFGLNSLQQLKRSKISITPEQVHITAVTESLEEQSAVEQALINAKPEGIALIMDISAPRPVIAPFRFRMQIDGDKVVMQSCSSDTRASRDRILRAVRKAGSNEPPSDTRGVVPVDSVITAAAVAAVAVAVDVALAAGSSNSSSTTCGV